MAKAAYWHRTMLLHAAAFLALMVSGLQPCGGEASGSMGAHQPGGWLPVYGKWEAAGGEYRLIACQDGGNHLRSREIAGGSLSLGGLGLIGRPSWQDYRVSVRVLGGTDVPNLLLRVGDVWNCVQFGRYGERLCLYVFRDGEATTVADVPGGPVAFPETLAAEIRGDAFRGYSNGKLVVEHTFRAGEIPAEGKAGIQANHPNARFGSLETEVFQSGKAAAAGRRVEVRSIRLSSSTCGPQRVLVRVRDSAGADDVAAVSCDVLAVAPRRRGQGATVAGPGPGGARLPVEPLQRARRLSATESLWEGTFFSLYEGAHRVSVRVNDRDDATYTRATTLVLRARKGTYTNFGGKRVFDQVDPHPVWRGHVVKPDPGAATRWLTNYVWRVGWGPSAVRCQALTLEPVRAGEEYNGRRIVPDSGEVAIRPRLRAADGRELSGSIRRRLGEVTNLFGIQPTYEMATPAGKLVWWVRLLNGDPILRVGGTFTPNADMSLTCEYAVENSYPKVSCLSPGGEPVAWGRRETEDARPVGELSGNLVVWHPAGREAGPAFAYAFSRKPQPAGDGASLVFAPAVLRKGRAYPLPLLALAAVDSHVAYAKLPALREWAQTLASTALAVPRLRAEFRDLGTSGGKCRVAIERGYDFAANDWGIPDAGQLLALPWCADTNASPDSVQATGRFHTAFGSRPYAVTKGKRVVLELPLPDLAEAKLTPAYAPLTGDWLEKAAECIDTIATQQNPDGTFRGYERMDHYSLARMTLGLAVAYRGLAGRPGTQAKIATMLRRSLDRMMGLQQAAVGEEMRLHRGFTGGAEETAWRKGSAYQPFVYSPRWNVCTEMGHFVDQNLGHAHLFFTLLLYGHYVDADYLTRPAVRVRIEELIRFQWASQDWNGDIWRVFVDGGDAAGGGDGFEEDLAMILPRLAQRAGLAKPWVDLSARIAAMKYGALRHFDYLPVQNEWGLEFLTPIHHAADWTPESGWGRGYLGDVWYTGPAVCSGYYGPWYSDNVYKPIPEVFRHMWYNLLEDARDTLPVDGRHWLTIGGYCSEARLFDPFLGAVKLLRAHAIAKERDHLTPRTQGENIWNFAFYPAAMTVLSQELGDQHPFMREAVPVADAVTSPDRDRAPAYAWKLKDGAIVSVAAYRIREPLEVDLRVDGAKLGLPAGPWRAVDVKTGEERVVAPDAPLRVRVLPRAATTVRLSTAGG